MNLLKLTTTKLTIAFIVIVVILLWAPFGLKSTVGLFEEWPARVQFQRGHWKFDHHFFYIASRPLALLPFALAGELSPNSFVGFNLVMIGSFIGKGVVTYLLMKRLVPESKLLPLLTSTLFMLFPADEGLMSLRGVGIHLLIFVFLLLVYIFVVYWQHPEKILLWLLIWPLQLLIVASYEPLFPLIFMIPLLLVWLEKRITRQIIITSALWFLIPCVSIIWVLTLIAGRHTDYVNSQIEDSSDGSTIEIVVTNIWRMYKHHIEVWGDSFQQIDFQSSFTRIALFAGVLAAFLVWQSFRKAAEPVEEKSSGSLWRNGLLILAGLAIMILGFLPYTLTSFSESTFRVFYVAALGAGLTFAALISLISQIRYIGQPLAIVLSSIFIALAVLSNLNQHQKMADASASVQRLFGTIVETAPSVESGTFIIVVDEAQLYQDEWHLAGVTGVVNSALKYIYGWHVNGRICTVFSPFPVKYCEFNATEIVHVTGNGTKSSIPYEDAVIFRTHWNGEIELLETIPPEYLTEELAATYEPHVHIRPNANPPQRAFTVFSCWPIDECISPPKTTPLQEEVRLEFDQQVRGLGWELPVPMVNELWTTHRVSTIHLNLASETDLKIEFDINYVLDPAILESLTLEVNGIVIPIQHEIQATGVWYHGTIPQAVLKTNFNESVLRFSVDHIISATALNDSRELGLLFDWLHIYPVSTEQ